MFQALKIYFARRAYNRALEARRSYDTWTPGITWDIRISVALHKREAAAANHLARLIHPAAILSAF
jgi:hypothetical protein